MNQGWFAVFGALAAGVPQLVTVIVQSVSARGQRTHEADQAQAQRVADAAEAAAQRDAARAAAETERERELRAERVQQIREWREGVAAAHTAYRVWDAATEKSGPEPNIVGAVWFQSLRQHLPHTAPDYLLTHDDIQCDDDDAAKLGEEISRIAEDWLD